jgi:hypothetical protein
MAVSTSIVFIDTRVADYQILIDGLDAGTEYYLIDQGSDGLDQIASLLPGRSGLDALHIISHGSAGTLYLGGSVLSNASLSDYSVQLQKIGESLSATGDILLYGCNVGAGDTGMQFIASLAQATGADVAASRDLTGAAALGGDWVLEASIGTIDSASIAPPAAFNGVLTSGIPIRLPFDSLGAAIAVTQAPGASFSHVGVLYNSWDFALAYGTPVLAVADGTIVDIRETVLDGGAIALPDSDGDSNPLNDDSSLGSGAIGNFVTIRHSVNGQTFHSTYMHLQAKETLNKYQTR